MWPGTSFARNQNHLRCKYYLPEIVLKASEACLLVDLESSEAI